MRHGSLFSGIGGFDLAAEWMGWENVFHCEWNEFGQKVLNHYWPKAISYHDITKTDFTIHRGDIDILTGGFPCQPYSMAGKRKGKEDERHLWPEMLRAITEIQPRWVVGENVLGLVNWSGGLVFHEVQADLEAAGYEVFPYVLPAVSVNSVHRRDRIWFVAHSNGNRYRAEVGRINDETTGLPEEDWQERSRSGQPDGAGDVESGRQAKRVHDCNGISRDAANTEGNRNANGDKRTRGAKSDEFCDDNAADNFNISLQRSKNIGITAESGKESYQQPTRFFRTAWKEFPTQSPLCSRDDGISYGLDGITFPKWRAESIKAYGNAIVPQVVYQIFKAIEQYEDTHHHLNSPATD